MRRSLMAVVFLSVMTFSAAASAGKPELSSEMTAVKIVIEKENHEIRVPAETVYPNDMVEYTLVCRNTGDESASDVGVIGPVPTGTSYLDKTASEIDGATPVFSIDGGESYHQAPVTYEVVRKDGSREIKTATPDMITHIKWVVAGEIDAGREVKVSYRVQVK
ncbi:MAG: DUF11 domain-containing protein [Candidatus Krumholzibacteriota bacterium]|nr:DUF11 domain-containing protein [Candidatus Krumholzibacteriota bacterium]